MKLFKKKEMKLKSHIVINSVIVAYASYFANNRHNLIDIIERTVFTFIRDHTDSDTEIIKKHKHEIQNAIKEDLEKIPTYRVQSISLYKRDVYLGPRGHVSCSYFDKPLEFFGI